MAKPLRILEGAALEAHQAWQWYRDRSEQAGQRFQKALEEAIEKIQEHPDRWPEYIQGTKYVTVKRFPYLLIYRESEHEIQVIAVAHSHRRQDYWQSRLN
jgi:toxin ParE2